MRKLVTAALAVLATCSLQAPLLAEDAVDPHRHHRAAMSDTSVKVERHAYAIPDIQLQDEHGRDLRLRDLFADDRPIALNFIFTSCTTICPVMTATMLQLQGQLADDGKQPHYVSISIDPDYDSSEILSEYASRYGADWTFLTGNSADVLNVLQAFDAYRGSKVNHFALTLMKAANDGEWTRIEGLTSAQDLATYWRDIGS